MITKELSFLAFVLLATALLLTRRLNRWLAAFWVRDTRLQLRNHLTDVLEDLSAGR